MNKNTLTWIDMDFLCVKYGYCVELGPLKIYNSKSPFILGTYH